MQNIVVKNKGNSIKGLLEVVSDIPRLPSVISKILEVVDNPLSSAEDLNEIISRDPSLTAQILKAANSAFYGFPNKIGTIYLAIIILGFNMVRTIALSAGVIKLFRTKGGKSPLLNPNTFWEHSLKCGVASKLLATNYKYYVAGEAFTAGILHDVGRIVLAHYLTPQYDEVFKHAAKTGCSLLEAEKTILDFTHAEIGGMLLQKWNLPISIVDAVTHHHEPRLSENAPDLAAITQLGDYMSHLHSFRNGEEKEEPTPNIESWKALLKSSNEKETIETLMMEFAVELKKASSFMRILRSEPTSEDDLKKTI